jgi:hypothetical protein
LNKRTLAGGFAAALLATSFACSSSPATNSSNTAVVTNTANRPAAPANTAAPANANQSGAANTAGAANSAVNQDFTLVNKTGVEIHALHVSPHNSDDWEEDVLGKDTLADGESIDIKFGRDEKAAMWDLRIEDKSGNHIEWENLNLLEISKATLHYKDGKATAEVE